MFRFILLSCAVTLFTASSSFAVTVTGTVLLQDQQDHSGTRIIFTESSPSAVTDTSYSGVSGFYSLDVAIGIYDIEFSHDGFVPVTWNDVAILVGQELESVTLISSNNTLSGNISGYIEPGIYYVIGDLTVPENNSLEIAAGTELRFTGEFQFLVEGLLRAIGTEQDSIIFTADNPADTNSWRGIHLNSSDTCRLEYCRVDHSSEDGIHASCYLECHHSLISDNDENGLYCAYIANVSDCVIRHNNYGGITCYSGGSCTLSHSVIENNLSGGINGSFMSLLTIENCIIRNNAGYYSGGIYLNEAACSVTHTLLTGNETALYCDGCHVDIVNCTISDNEGTAIVLDGPDHVAINSCIIAFSSDVGIWFGEYFSFPDYDISYNTFYQNSDGNIGNPEYGPPYLCQLVTRNSSLDSADVYLNVQVDPLFVNPGNGDYHLQFESHLINAGDPNLPLDPDGTIADIGAYYFDLGTGVDPRDFPVPQSYVSLSNYPNPFNPSTQIQFTLSEVAPVTLNIYDLLGRNVAELMNQSIMTKGSHNFSWNAESLPAGSYFAKLVTPNQTAAHRIVLLK